MIRRYGDILYSLPRPLQLRILDSSMTVKDILSQLYDNTRKDILEDTSHCIPHVVQAVGGYLDMVRVKYCILSDWIAYREKDEADKTLLPQWRQEKKYRDM